MNSDTSIRRGLVIQGGGAKGAFALGCMQALKKHGIDFSAVAGTSAGGLCAIIWSTGQVEEGVRIWKEIDDSGFFGRAPDGCLRRLVKILCIIGKLFVSYVKNVEPEGRPQYRRDIFCSLLMGVLAWLLLFNVLPLWGWLVAALIIPVVAVFAFANELPVVGWDNRVRQLLVDVIAFVATTRLLVSIAWLLMEAVEIVTLETRITLTETISSGIVLAMVRLPVRIHSTLMEGKLLASHINHFLQSPLAIPTYVTVAREVPPNSPHFALPTPGVFAAHYAKLDGAPEAVRAQFAYASAALPFGIFAHAEIGGTTYVDGGVADNTPVLPMGRHGVNEVWIICLHPDAFDLEEHLRNVYMQTMFLHGPTKTAEGLKAMEEWLKIVKVVYLVPRVFLGGLLTGTLNFNRRRTEALLRHGYRIATRALQQRASGIEQPARRYHPHFGRWTRLRLLRRALPACSMWRLFGKGDANREAMRDFHIPPGVRPKPGDEGSASWFWSVVMVWLLFITDALRNEYPVKRAIWGTFAALLMIVLPTWWARLKRNLGIRT
ncbi:patatin-like phospholipase family protein [Bradyrhizobium cosmicum]|uniref:patatin-like phospholipase family protein n=1 Tax=Bradyrhizobium cosmicum TaxID=1404864 RepID=UPI0028EA24C1|nr:patatin-like phospholipase family protein [Bradyrhizobium cosmicum]